MTKRLLWILVISLTITKSFGQPVDSKNICERIVEIDTTEYRSNFVDNDLLKSTNRFVKTDGKLTIRTTGSVYTFIDNNEHGDYDPLFRVAGEDVNRNWIWIEEQDLHTVKYFLINVKTSHIDTLIGPPKIFGDKIVCLEEGYTDSPRHVEIYRIKTDKIVLIKSFRLSPCDQLCCVESIYLRGKTIFLSDNWKRRWKARVL
jgi:hypothetical protein